jgi:hypothetical protein
MVMDVSRLRTLGWPATTDFEAGVRKHTNGTLPTWHGCARVRLSQSIRFGTRRLNRTDQSS